MVSRVLNGPCCNIQSTYLANAGRYPPGIADIGTVPNSTLHSRTGCFGDTWELHQYRHTQGRLLASRTYGYPRLCQLRTTSIKLDSFCSSVRTWARSFLFASATCKAPPTAKFHCSGFLILSKGRISENGVPLQILVIARNGFIVCPFVM
jgi:hypothetical protein